MAGKMRKANAQEAIEAIFAKAKEDALAVVASVESKVEAQRMAMWKALGGSTTSAEAPAVEKTKRKYTRRNKAAAAPVVSSDNVGDNPVA